MNKVALAFSTKDRVELSRQTVEPLLQPDKFDLWWIDGSDTPPAQQLPLELTGKETHLCANVRGGADAAIVYSLTALLDAPEHYGYVGLVENDVLLAHGWFEDTMALFERGASDGLKVGAASARCYEDRVLIQRDGYAICHNLGAGMVIFSREAARIALAQYRTTFSTENRKLFALLSGIDIGRFWAFQGSEHWLCADWGVDKNLAQHGYASVATTPSYVEMIGQDPPLDKQGLTIARAPVESRRDNTAFEVYRHRLNRLRVGELQVGFSSRYQDASGTWTIFPHQLPAMGAQIDNSLWQLKWSQGFGPFSWQALEAGATITISVFGACGVIVGGGKTGGRLEVTDTYSGFRASPQLLPEGSSGRALTIEVPAGLVYRDITIRALEPGPVFYGLSTREAQPWYPEHQFDHSVLPGV